MFTGLLSFKRRIHTEQIGLIRNLGNGSHHAGDVLGLDVDVFQLVGNGNALICKILHHGFHFHQSSSTGSSDYR